MVFIKNYFYLVAAGFSFMATLAHAWYTQEVVMPAVEKSSLEPGLQDAIFMSWHLATSTSLISGTALLIMAFYRHRTATIALAWLIIAIHMGRYATFLGTGLIRNPELIKDATAQTIFMGIYVGIMIAGIQKDRRTLKDK